MIKTILHFVPGKIIFGRSHVREVAVKRLRQIDDYCSVSLIVLDGMNLLSWLWLYDRWVYNYLYM
jgi:hypothetical protein